MLPRLIIGLHDDILFGENWNNQDIDLKTRCMITVVALMAQGITDSSLKYHIENAGDDKPKALIVKCRYLQKIHELEGREMLYYT